MRGLLLYNMTILLNKIKINTNKFNNCLCVIKDVKENFLM